ncbi:hypothetical protein ABPG74_010418 [Tetrahymena malaccensis]
MSNLVINQLQVQLNQTIENIQAHQHLIILVRLGSQVRRTQVWSGDKFQGQWNDDVRLNRSTEDSLEIRLSALETPQSSSGQLLGVAKIPFSQIQQSSTIQEWFPLIIKEQEAGKVYAKIQYLGEYQTNLGTPSHAQAGVQHGLEQRSQYSQYQAQSPTFAASNNQVPAGSGFSQYAQQIQIQQQPQQQQVVQSQTPGLPQGYQVYQGSPIQEQGQHLVSPQSQHQIFVQNMQGAGLPTQEQIIQQIQNRFQQQQVPQSQYPPRQVVQIPQQQQQQQFQYIQQPPPQPLSYQQFQQLQLQKASQQQQPQVIQVAQNQLGQHVQYVQQPQGIQAQQQVIGGYQVQQQQQQYAPYQAQQQQQQQNKYRVNSVSTLQPRQLVSGVERQSSSQLRLLPYDQAQQQQIQADEMQGLVNAFDNQLVIHNPPAVVGLPQQQTDFISQQPLMQSVVRLVPSSQYQEQLQQSPSQQVVHISGQPLIQEIQQPQFQTLSNSQLRLVPVSQIQYQQQQQQLQQQTQPVQGITLLGRQNVSQQQQVQQQPIQQQVSPVPMQIPGQPLSNSQIRIIPLNQAQQISAAQQQQQQIISYQPQQQQQVQYAYSPQVQYVNQQGLPQQGYGMQQGSHYQQQQQLNHGVQLISQPYGQLQYQQ